MYNHLRKDFLWGASTSGFQVEGAYNLDGKGVSTIDIRNVPDGIANSHVASDQYHHLEEDIQLMKELGIQIYRFSFQWSRIMSDGYTVNEKGIKFYEKLIKLCKENDIIPFPTLYHFEMPQALVDKFGGWKSRECIDAFVHYASVCFQRFHEEIEMWGTINEQLIACAASDLNGNHECDEYQKLKNMYQMSYHMSLAEKKAIEVFRKIIPKGKIGPVCSMQVVYPESSSPKNILAAQDAKDFLQGMFLDMSVYGKYPLRVIQYLKEKGLMPISKQEDEIVLKNNTIDFIGVNYYSSTCIRTLNKNEDNSKLPPFYRNELFTLGDNKYLEKTKWMEYGIDPEGLYIGIREVYEKYQLPVIITENGLACSEELKEGKIDDEYRIDYLKKHIEQCEKLVFEGYPLLGYCPWSLVDLVSSHQGFSKRYGLIFVDRTDTDVKKCERIPKESYYWYQNMIKMNKGENKNG